MRTRRVGWPTTLALAVVVFVAVSQTLPQLTVPAVAVTALALAAVGSWLLDIIASVADHYRNSRDPNPIGQSLRYHAGRRTPSAATLTRNVVVVVALFAAVSVGFGTGVAVVDQSTPSVDLGTAADGVTEAGETIIEERVNESEVEQAIHDRVNEVRRERGVRPLVYSEQVSDSASDHSESMAQRGELAHADLEAQYACQEMAENVAYTYTGQDIQTENGTVNYYGNETAIAHGIVRQWMDSEQHRANLLDPSYTGEGIGVATAMSDDGQRVYATQALCG